MPKESEGMTGEQRLFYEANGFLVLPELLKGAELAKVQAAAGRAEAIWREDLSRPGGRGENLLQVQSPIEYDVELLRLLAHPATLPIVRQILGDDISMIDNDLFISLPHAGTHAHWHRDVGMRGVYHPLSTLMVKVFYLLSDVAPEGGGTALLPGSHRFPPDVAIPQVTDPEAMPGHVKMAYPAGTAYLFNGRCLHAALNNRTGSPRRALIYNYGHFWMKQWSGYEPSDSLKAKANTPLMRQLLGIGDAYGTWLQE
ncbi:MAG TPA: phytanoyl-CoA dioxygenase family protein [Chthonomonadales bacterium]|nr:phytanoyl-CoA dioxygenase family protein [Chthonomonadales bacterium]